MLSNGDQGCLLQAFSLMVKPLHILELGAFTGYSTICLSRGLQEGGSIDTIEVYDELEDIIRGGFRRAGLIDVAGREDIAHLHIGDAKKIIPTLDKMYDIVYIDANKREYKEYYDLVFDKIRPGGYILADNVLWSGKVLLDNPPKDAQTQSIIAFNKMVASDPRVENTILPIRDGINVIYKL
jgi:predicted O-methyltransferase YrrM